MNERRKATSRGTSALKWHQPGGKHYLAKRIIELMPPHVHYVEPFFGGGSVLFAKDPEGVSEVVNDLNGELMNFWYCLAGEEFLSLKETLERTPFSSDVFNTSQQTAINGCGRVARAAWLFIRYRQSRQGLGKDFATLTRNRVRRGMNEQVSSWLSAIEGLPEAHARLKRVVILNRPAIDVIAQQDGGNTLFYLDPPYLHETRVTTCDYEHEMSEEDHAELLAALKHVEGRFILSGYRSELYGNAAIENDWHRVDIEIDNKASSKKVKDKKTECLWMNYEPNTQTKAAK